ncbi:uncharacterized protein LOC129591692 [Paramacrobiotus metropolitanus]|uniref:uncharacterized protein LOC129591692 n=1 Tax=Paramacrobiotus metropolitanus TaxID=2943436 RepID=UPI0024465D69|nr:uncharacterized protein LOC129591692 [Paramacrobiotus metropolitanus]
MDLFHVCRTVMLSGCGLQLWKYSVWIFLFHIPFGYCMRCYFCSTTNINDHCVTNPGLETLPYAADCQKSFCLKTEIYFPNGTFMSLARDCIDTAMHSGCLKGSSAEENLDQIANYGKTVDKQKEFRVCSYFCSKDLCNAGRRSLMKGGLSMHIAVLITTVLTVFMSA